MHQTKLESVIESTVNQLSGIVVALAWWTWVIVPVMGFEVTFIHNIGVTLSFTVISMVRSYLWRRFFNAGLHKAVHQMIRRG